MTIIKERNGKKLTIFLTGRLDTATAPDLESAIKDEIKDAEKLIFNLKELEYLSSAGLRVLLGTQKQISTHGSMVVKNANSAILEVFEITGFSDILTIEA